MFNIATFWWKPNFYLSMSTNLHVYLYLSQEPMNEYGHHPYYMIMEDDEGNSHSVLLYNSNAMGKWDVKKYYIIPLLFFIK